MKKNVIKIVLIVLLVACLGVFTFSTIKIFKWNDKQERLPIIDTKGTRGYPGEAVYCRCQALAYYVDLDKYKPVWLGNNKGYKFINKNNSRK